MSQSTEPSINGVNLLYRLAVLIMSTISFFTTAYGAMDLFGPIMSWGLAAGVSILLIAVAFNMPKAYQQSRLLPLILGYFFIAVISVIFNFNFIYGKFSAEDLLYTELINKREAIDELQVSAQQYMDEELDITNLREEIETQQQVMQRELDHPTPGESGAGPRYEAAALRKRLAEEKLAVREETKKYYYDRLRTNAESLKSGIDNVIESGADITAYRTVIENTVKGHNELRNFLLTEGATFDTEAMKFVNKDIGKLNHTMWTFSQFSDLTGKQKASFIVALVLSIAIDFVILFVLAIVARYGETNHANAIVETDAPAKEQKPTPKEVKRRSDDSLFFGE